MHAYNNKKKQKKDNKHRLKIKHKYLRVILKIFKSKSFFSSNQAKEINDRNTFLHQIKSNQDITIEVLGLCE